ncbi:MAG: Hsp20/alpha crystallin family protein [Ignavibacteriae bacterium]|nr:Hsp20/alpha crystallin family protein [Ignavibacteriota bacterium]MCB9207298.1 Hsp20/alpha crystallin family protein [Ignavibacteriales bacterium]MCB9209025.1 Hsp20/alpha crystallin family protein [Ignavibacteriales bacterium]MCB9218053.1 Hsp20/alpha crystallin family protein [Ignavibacteriales bacterium]
MEDTKALTKVEEKRSWEEALEKESWVAPLVDIYETNDDYYIVANMPGVAKDDVKLKVEEGDLVIMGRINFEGERLRKYLMKEIDSSNYYRKFNLTESVNEDKIDAKLENGRLFVHLPKVERVKPKIIEIK